MSTTTERLLSSDGETRSAPASAPPAPAGSAMVHIHDHHHDGDHDHHHENVPHHHEHGHGHGHDHGHAGAEDALRASGRLPPSLVRASLGARLAIAIVVSAAIWGAVVWARAPIALP